MVVDTFGLATGGRPRRTVARANFPGQPSAARSGARSRSESGTVECSFPLIGFSHADDPVLTIVLPVVLDGQRNTRQHFLGPGHVQPSGPQGGRALCRIELNRHRLMLLVESTTGAVAVGGGGSCSRRLSPLPVPHSSPWLRFQSPLVEPDVRISRIRLSDEIMPSPTESSSCARQGA